MQSHETNMRSIKANLVSHHYRGCNHTYKDDTVHAVNYETDKNKRLKLEELLMVLLDTIHQKGLNSKW